MIVIEANRTAYSASNVRRTMTVAELIEKLEEYNPDDKVVLSHDKGYTFGGITYFDFQELDEEDEFDNEEDIDE